jgi:hypothetical protein
MANSNDDRAQASLLQLTGSDLLLVLCVFHCVGGAQLHRNLLASSACIVRRHHPFGHGNRLRCKLAQPSHASLRYHRATLLDRGRNIPAVRPKNGSRQQPFSLAIRSHRSGYRILSGMALRQAFLLIAFGKDINT